MRKPRNSKARTTCRLGASTGNLGMRLGDEGFQNWRVCLGGISAECLHMEADGGPAIRQRGLVRISLTNHDAIQAERVSNVPVGMFLHDDFQGSHAKTLDRQKLKSNVLLRKIRDGSEQHATRCS